MWLKGPSHFLAKCQVAELQRIRVALKRCLACACSTVLLLAHAQVCSFVNHCKALSFLSFCVHCGHSTSFDRFRSLIKSSVVPLSKFSLSGGFLPWTGHLSQSFSRSRKEQYNCPSTNPASVSEEIPRPLRNVLFKKRFRLLSADLFLTPRFDPETRDFIG